MRLALQTDYALRTLLYLTATHGRASAGQVARFFKISAHHVAKVVNQLSRLGLVRSIRGLGGGIELGRPANEITVGQVVLAFEGNLHLLECIGTEGICVIQPGCKLRSVLAEAERRQVAYLNEVRLSDLVGPGEPLLPLVSLSLSEPVAREVEPVNPSD